jgi:hypothetical protein
MKGRTIVKNKNITNNQRVKRSSHNKNPIMEKTKINPVYERLAGEGHEDFYNYLDWLGLAKNLDLLILTSSHHYYFEVEDLKNVMTVINLNKLNNIKNIKEFLQAIYTVLPHKCYFVGSFTDNKKHNGFLSSKKTYYRIEAEEPGSDNEMGPWNSFLNMVYGIIDLKTIRYMSEKSVKLLLESTGFKILDMTEFNDLTYFCTQKDDPSVE